MKGKRSRRISSRRRGSRSTKKRSSPRTKTRTRRTILWMIVALCLGIALGFALYSSIHPLITFTQRVRMVDQLLSVRFYQLEVSQKDIHKREEPQRKGIKAWTLIHWEVTLPQGISPNTITSQLEQQLQETCRGITIASERTADGTEEIGLKIDGLLVHHLILRPPPPLIPPIKPPKLRLPRVVIVVDDIGLDKTIAEELLRLDFPVTFSILPFQPFSRRIAQKAHAQGREVILHLPMEPRGYPLKDPGQGALFVSMSEKALLSQLREDIEAVPYIKGVNNHMGSRFMEQGEKVRLVLGVLQRHDLFFLDSLTTPQSEGYRIAQTLDMETGERDLFLDDESNNVEHTKGQLVRLIEIARINGTAIGICHPYPPTITALQEMASVFKQQGIEVVPLSQVLE